MDEIIREEIARPLGLEQEFMVGIGPIGTVKSHRLATLSSSMVAGRNAASRAEIEELIKESSFEERLEEQNGHWHFVWLFEFLISPFKMRRSTHGPLGEEDYYRYLVSRYRHAQSSSAN